ncbi:MAG: serine/threonine-protein kinase [Candidatus Sumerlaeia bacterium]|nr:serine/threonine-protein kinase [Candidatus Sumerlaeia bacterium]
MDSATPSQPPSLPRIEGIELERLIGRGGMGSVYLGRQPYLERRVAVKIVSVQGMSNQDNYVERFRREARSLAALAHPNIVACYQAGTTAAGEPYLAMEYVDGPTLHDFLRGSGPLDPSKALAIVRATADALRYALDNGIIHRDIKPENILLQKRERAPEDDPFPYTPRLVDLGLARVVREDDMDTKLTADGMVLGTPPMMAPEQFDAPEKVDFRADIYALGCVLHHLLTGKRAFPEAKVMDVIKRKMSGDVPDPRAIRADLPDPLAELCRKMMAAQPHRRHASYQELLAEIDGLRSTLGMSSDALRIGGTATPATARGTTPVDLDRQPRGGGTMMPAATIGGGLLLVAIIVLVMIKDGGDGGTDTAIRTTPPPAPTTAPTPQPTATPAATATPRPAAIFPDDGQPLIGGTIENSKTGWIMESGLGFWDAAQDFESGIVGAGTSHIARPLAADYPGDAHRLDGSIQLLPGAKEGGVLLHIEGGMWYGVAFQALDETTLTVSTVGFDADAEDWIATRRVLDSRVIEPGAGGPTGFSLLRDGAALTVAVHGETFAPIPVEGGATEAAVLYSNSNTGPVWFPELQVAVPVR